MYMKIDGFIVDIQYHVTPEGAVIHIYGRTKTGKTYEARTPFKPYFYIEKEDVSYAEEIAEFDHEETTKTTFEEKALIKINLRIPQNVASLRDTFQKNGINCYEADIPFTSRFLIDKKIQGTLRIEGEGIESERTDLLFKEPEIKPSSWKPASKDLLVMSIDIEMSKDKDLYCISSTTNRGETKSFVVEKETKKAYTGSTEEVLEQFKEYLLEKDPDILTGWNVIDFDLVELEKLYEEHSVPFDYGRRKNSTKLRIQDSFIRDSSATIEGRMVLDGIHLLKNNFISLQNYKLETAAKEFTDEKKIFSGENKAEDIEKSYHEDIDTLLEYNQLDTTLVLDILDESQALEVTLYRSLLTGMVLDRVSASIASFDSLYLKKLDDKNMAAPVTSYRKKSSTTGGYVMESTPGIYTNVAVCDFKSLYPSIMITFNIDPVTHARGEKKKEQEEKEDVIIAPNDAWFTKEKGILPTVLETLWDERSKAKQQGESVKSYAIKILMNSMYGVLASNNCRFYSHEMANAITSFGHRLIKQSQKILEKEGHKVIYGDTDSIFVNLGEMKEDEAKQKGDEITQQINTFYDSYTQTEYGVANKILLEFEKLYTKFFIPSHRGSSGGAKKRYAGKKEGELEFTGLEYVRRDWTEAAKELQYNLIKKAFEEEDLDEYLRDYVENVRNGKYDDKLIYTKGMTKKPSEYKKTTPQHVKAAKKLDSVDSNIIEYVITVDGPEPVQNVRHSIDYNHYVEKQLKPVSESILEVLNKKFDDVLRGTTQSSLANF